MCVNDAPSQTISLHIQHIYIFYIFNCGIYPLNVRLRGRLPKLQDPPHEITHDKTIIYRDIPPLFTTTLVPDRNKAKYVYDQHTTRSHK